MKGKVIRGRCILWLMKYLFGQDKTKKNTNSRTIGGNLAASGPVALAKCLYKVWKNCRKKLIKPVLHIPLRMPKGEDVSDQLWVDITKALMEKMEISFDRPWILVKHGDEHVHLVASRYDYNGKPWQGRWEALKLIKATHELEKEFGLTQTPTLDTAEWNKTRLTSDEIYQSKKQTDAGIEPGLPPRQVLADVISEAIEMANGSFQRFKSRLATKNVSIQFNTSKSTSHISGISFGLNGFNAKGSKIARAYSWGGIVTRLKAQKNLINQSVRQSIKELPVPVIADLRPEILSDLLVNPELSEPVSIDSVPKPSLIQHDNPLIQVPVASISTPDSHKPKLEVQPAGDVILDPNFRKRWRHNLAFWDSARQILLNKYHLDPRMVDYLKDNRKLWAVDGNAIVAARQSFSENKIRGLARFQLDSDILSPTVLAPEQPALFNIVNRFDTEKRVIVTANAIEAVSYYELSYANHPDCPRGFVVSADGDLPPAWLIDLVKRRNKQLLLATKTKKTGDEIRAALPQLYVQGRPEPWFELDVSNSESWNQLLKERAVQLPKHAITGTQDLGLNDCP